MKEDPIGPIYIQLSDEVRDVLSRRSIDLEGAVKDELLTQGHSVDTELGPDPTSTESDRELVLIILAGAAAASLVGSAVAKIIDSVSRKKHAQYTERQLTPALDGKGKPIRDRDGNPVFSEIQKPGPAPQGEISTAEVTVGRILHFKFTSGSARKNSEGAPAKPKNER